MKPILKPLCVLCVIFGFSWLNSILQTPVESQALKQGKPKLPQQVIDFIYEVFGDEMPRFIREELEEEAKRKGMEKGMEIQKRTFTLKALGKFPHWNDAEVADFVRVPEEYVRQLRREAKI